MVMSKDEMLRLMVDTGLYLVTEESVPSERRLQAVGEALAAGARVVQLRDKSTPRRQLLEEARAMKELCARWHAVFIVNDDVAIGWAADADGVHVGQNDFPAEEARRLLGEGKLVGLSVTRVDQALAAERLGVDCIGVGAMFDTPTKVNARVGGLNLMREVRRAVRTPLVGIGGIDADNAASVFEAGADSVAVVRGVFAQPSVASATRRLLAIAREARGQKGD